MARRKMHWLEDKTNRFACGISLKRDTDKRLVDYCVYSPPSGWDPDTCLFLSNTMEEALEKVLVKRKDYPHKPWCKGCLAELEHQVAILKLEGK